MTETLQELCNLSGVKVRVDRTAGVIRGVKILGLESRNGRSYPAETLARAAQLYENAKVNVNHPKGGPAQPRDYQDRIGAIRNVSLRRGEGLFGDFHFNPKHALAEQLAWDAEHTPQNVGFSHNVQAKTARRGDRVIVESIERVQSVDLVADPATTAGLFEQAGENAPEIDAALKAGLDQLTVETLKKHRPDLVEEIASPLEAELAELREKLEQFEAQEAVRLKRSTVERLLREHGLPLPDARDAAEQVIVGPRFFETLLASPDEEAVRELIEERAALVQSIGGSEDRGRVRAREQRLLEGAQPVDVKTFVRAIT